MANLKKRVMPMFMALVMLFTMVPMNAFAVGEEDFLKLICEKEEVAHTAECYVHTEECYHKHTEPGSIFGVAYGCQYVGCTAHTHSVDNGCPIANCDAHAHNADCCSITEHEHTALKCYYKKQVCGHGYKIWKCSDSCYEMVLTCTAAEHTHGTGCDYSSCAIPTTHTHDADCYSCTVAEHTHDETCQRSCGLTTEDFDPIKCNDATLALHTVDCGNEEHHIHSLSAGCYLPGDAVKNAFFKATGVEIETTEELAAVLNTVINCESGCGYEIVSIVPEFEIEMVLCEEHFCTICRRLNDTYCDCVEITFANIFNDPANTKIVKVANGETVAADAVPAADMINFHFLGWFDENGNEFNVETVYTEDVTFTAQYKALTEAEKLENAINFVKNNFNLGAELGRMITILSKGEITKATIAEEKDTVIKAIELYLLTNQLTGKITADQAKEIVDLMKQGDEYTTLFAEWLWPENAVLMPEVDEILADIDFEKLAEEVKDMIEAEYGVEFTQEWLDENRALAEQYIAEALKEAETISEEQKQVVLEQLDAEKENAAAIMAMIRCEMVCTIADEIAHAKEIFFAMLADTELGIRIGKIISQISGVNNDYAMANGAQFKEALIAAIEMSGMADWKQDAVVTMIEENEQYVVDVINWLWPETTVIWVVENVVVETDVVPFDAEHIYDGETPVKEGDAEFTYTFSGWNQSINNENSTVTYTAVFNGEVNEYTVTWMNGETVLLTESVPYGTTPEYNGETPVKEGNAQYTYTFAGWDKEITAVTGDVTYTARFEASVNSYTVTFVVDGVETTAVYAYGAMPEHADPVKAADAAYTYKFAGWDKEFAPVTGDVTYTAIFEAIPVIYTVTWMVNGEAVEVDSVTYGAMPEYNGETPAMEGNAQYTYTFAGWGEITAVTGDVTYTALFDSIVNEYTVTWVDEDGTVLLTETYAYGETPVYTGATPFKADTAAFYYDFAGWGEITAVTGDVTYTAQYNATRCTYRVTFKDGDKTLSSLIYAYGDTIVAPELPTRKGFNSEWNCEFSTVTGELTVEVVWSYQMFASHKLLVYVGYGKSATDNSRGWFQTTDGTIYNARSYYSYYVDDKFTGSSVMTEGVDYESYTAAPGNITVDGIVYGNNTGSDFYVINEMIMVATAAQYHLDCHATLYHTVTFVDYNGNVIDTVVVEHGADVTAPADPTRMGYVFTGWDNDFANVTESVTVTAQYDYEYLESSRLKINVGNGTPASGSTKGNALSHWGRIYNTRSYYSYYDYPNYKGDSIMSTDDFDYARTSAEAIPGNVKYDGVVYTNGEGTSDNYYVLLNDGVYVACRGEYHLDYKASFYNVYTFVVDGVETKVAALHGTNPVAPADPSKDGYEFDGWEIDEDGVYNAKFTKIHTVTFYLPAMAGGGSVKVIVRDGETVDPYEVKDTADYDFKYWYLYEKSANNNHLHAFDFSTPITADTRFDARVETIKHDYVLGVYVTVDGKNVRIGTGSISDVANPKEFYGIYNNVVQKKHYSWSNIDLGDTFENITVNGETFVYGEPNDIYVTTKDAKDATPSRIYTFETSSIKVGKYSGRNEFYYYTVGSYTLYYRVVYSLPNGSFQITYVKAGEKMDEFSAEKYCQPYETVKHFYNSNGGKVLDFATYVVNAPVLFCTKTMDKYGDWNVALKGTLNGETFELGTAVINDVKHAGCWRNNNNRYDITAYDASLFTMPEMQTIVVDGVTYTYGAGSSDNYYTVDFTNLSCYSIKNSKNKVVDWEYHYTGEISLFHNAKVILTCDGADRRTVKLDGIAHGTVITTEWMLNNKYLPIGFSLAEDVVINEGIEYRVDWVENN